MRVRRRINQARIRRIRGRVLIASGTKVHSGCFYGSYDAHFVRRISISPGCSCTDPLDMQLDSKHSIGCAPRRSLTSHLEWKYVVETLREKFHRVKLPKRFIPVNLGASGQQKLSITASPVKEGESSSGNVSGEGSEAPTPLEVEGVQL
jgi:hypothetical protein